MISEEKAEMYCCEDVSLIENYEKAVADQTQVWQCHHRAEILPCSRFSSKTLKKFHLYYGQPAERLIFLPPAEHLSLHHKGKILSQDIRSKISKTKKGQASANAGSFKRGLVPWNKGKRGVVSASEETRRKMSEAHKGHPGYVKGMHWFNNGTCTVLALECPEGFRPGRLKA